MKDNLIIFSVVLIVAIVFGICCRPVKETQPVTVYYTQTQIDSIENEYSNTIMNLYLIQDSLNNIINEKEIEILKLNNSIDTIVENNIIANYKLERIKYYNSIAKGNQLQFLRGWINRVLNNED